MSRTVLLSGVFVGFVVLASMFAPAPSLRAQQSSGSGSLSGPSGSGSGSGSGQSPACRGLQNALNACQSNPGSHNGCAHIREQLIAHGCFVSSGSGSGISSGSR
jgi:hypothetical protein